MRRIQLLAPLAVAALALTACSGAGGAPGGGTPGVLTIGMTAGDIPNLDTVLAGGQGFEGYRFVRQPALRRADPLRPQAGGRDPKVVPGLATSWTRTRPVRCGRSTCAAEVTFTDGTPFNADAVVYNLDRYLNKKSPQLLRGGERPGGDLARRHQVVQEARRVDDRGRRQRPYSHLPEDLVFIYMASPTALQKYGNQGFANHPVGHRPVRLQVTGARPAAIFTANQSYWAAHRS